MSEASSLAVILPRILSGASHSLLDALGPNVAQTLGKHFSRTVLCYRHSPANRNWQWTSQRLLKDVELEQIRVDFTHNLHA